MVKKKVLAILAVSCFSVTSPLWASALEPVNSTQPNFEPSNNTISDRTRTYEQALTFYDRALSIEPNATDVLTNKGLLLIQLQRYDEAIEVFDKVLDIEPNNVDSLYNKGLILEKIGRLADAQKYYDIVEKTAPGYKPELVNRVSESLDVAESQPSLVGSAENQTVALGSNESITKPP